MVGQAQELTWFPDGDKAYIIGKRKKTRQEISFLAADVWWDGPRMVLGLVGSHGFRQGAGHEQTEEKGL